MCQQKFSEEGALAEQRLYKHLSQKNQQLAEFLLDHLTQSTHDANPKGRVLQNSKLKELLRIVGGVPALEGEFNECCLVGSRNSNNTINWFCTGALIHSKVVVTAAHCINPGGGYVVALNTNNQNNLQQAEIINVRKAHVHPGYLQTKRFNDISVLILQNAAVTAPIRPASLQEINSASEVMLVGFGNDDIASTKGFGIKRKVEVDITSIRRDAHEDLNADEALYGYESDLEFVAGGKGYDTCNGDSGGPVYIIEGQERMVAGLTSRLTANSEHPCGDGGVYTRLDVHASFISSLITQL